MTSKAYILKRICIFSDKEIDPDSDEQVKEVLQDKFKILLPQRRSMNETLKAVASDHEIIDLILKYRSMDN